MTTVHQIAQYGTVERIEAAAAGARRGVLEFLEGGSVAEIEIMQPDLVGLDRIVYAPLSKLRRVP
jgi:hypothetical protein